MNGWKCPKCGSPNLRLKVETWAFFIQTLDSPDNEFTLDHMTEPHWNDNSPMDCNECGYEATMKHFKWHTPPKGTINVFNEQSSNEHPTDWHIHT